LLLTFSGHLIADESGDGEDDPVSVLERCQADNQQLMNEMSKLSFPTGYQ
jgi:hypothetical protein